MLDDLPEALLDFSEQLGNVAELHSIDWTPSVNRAQRCGNLDSIFISIFIFLTGNPSYVAPALRRAPYTGHQMSAQRPTLQLFATATAIRSL